VTERKTDKKKRRKWKKKNNENVNWPHFIIILRENVHPLPPPMKTLALRLFVCLVSELVVNEDNRRESSVIAWFFNFKFFYNFFMASFWMPFSGAVSSLRRKRTLNVELLTMCSLSVCVWVCECVKKKQHKKWQKERRTRRKEENEKKKIMKMWIDPIL